MAECQLINNSEDLFTIFTISSVGILSTKIGFIPDVITAQGSPVSTMSHTTCEHDSSFKAPGISFAQLPESQVATKTLNWPEIVLLDSLCYHEKAMLGL